MGRYSPTEPSERVRCQRRVKERDRELTVSNREIFDRDLWQVQHP